MSVQSNINSALNTGTFLLGQTSMAEATKDQASLKRREAALKKEFQGLGKSMNLDKNMDPSTGLDVIQEIDQRITNIQERLADNHMAQGKDTRDDLIALAKWRRISKTVSDLRKNNIGGDFNV